MERFARIQKQEYVLILRHNIAALLKNVINPPKTHGFSMGLADFFLLFSSIFVYNSTIFLFFGEERYVRDN